MMLLDENSIRKLESDQPLLLYQLIHLHLTNIVEDLGVSLCKLTSFLMKSYSINIIQRVRGIPLIQQH